MRNELKTRTKPIDNLVDFNLFEADRPSCRSLNAGLFSAKTIAQVAIESSPIIKADNKEVRLMMPKPKNKTLSAKAAAMPKLRSMLVVVCSAIAFIISLSICAGSAYALSFEGDMYHANGELVTIDNLKGTVYLAYYPKKPSSNKYYIDSNDWPAEMINNLKSSNPKVIKASLVSKDEISIKLKVKKTGSTMLSYDLDGEKHAAKLVVRKYKKPFSKFKIGKKSFVSALKKNGEVIYRKKLSGKLTIKPAKGWKLKKLIYYNFESEKTKRIKSGFKFSKGLEDYTVIATFVNKKTKVLQDIRLWVSPA